MRTFSNDAIKYLFLLPLVNARSLSRAGVDCVCTSGLQIARGISFEYLVTISSRCRRFASAEHETRRTFIHRVDSGSLTSKLETHRRFKQEF